LKYTLAEKYQFNRENYTKAKNEFVKNITERQKNYINRIKYKKI